MAISDARESASDFPVCNHLLCYGISAKDNTIMLFTVSFTFRLFVMFLGKYAKYTNY